jgi:hypothetical protein
MEPDLTVVIHTLDAPSVLGAALIGRASEGKVEALAHEAGDLVRFFDGSVQRKLPRHYSLAICGPGLVHVNWDGELVRPGLMQALRRFMGSIRWYSGCAWEAEDVRAVGHIIGERNLFVDESAGSVADLVMADLGQPDDRYGAELARCASGRLSPQAEDDWGARLRGVVSALKAEPAGLSEAVALLMDGQRQELIDGRLGLARRVEEENRSFAREAAEGPLRFGELEMTCISLPAEKSIFWAEISGYALEAKDCALCLCHLVGRAVLLLVAAPEVRADLRVWAGYVTDLMPEARCVGASRNVVPVVVDGLLRDPGLKDKILGLLEDGAHLLRA